MSRPCDSPSRHRNVGLLKKIADLEDNMDVRRLQELDDKATARFRKYLAAYRILTSKT